MNEHLTLQVCGVLDKYDKNYSHRGVLANLNTWERNKGPLVDLLRKHPNWNEDALAVVFEVTESREIDRCAVNAYNSDVYRLYSDFGMSDEDACNLSYALNSAIGSYTKLLPDEQAVTGIKQYSGVDCAVGQKASRAINKICHRYGLDKHPEYNARFAQLADSLNPLQVKRTALLSVHPCDYLEMSNEDNSWSSCHCIRAGEYHGGTLSYMNDAVSMIFYTMDKDVIGPAYAAPKRTRQVFCYGNGILLQSRLYPQTNDEETRDIYRDIVQRTITGCLGIPNLWVLQKRQESVGDHCHTHNDALQYEDYIYSSYKANVSLLKEVYDEKRSCSLCIGHTAYCVDCGNTIYSNDHLFCSSCEDDSEYITCADCGERILYDSDDDYQVNGSHYCRDCVSWCEKCQEYVRGEMTEVIDRQGYRTSVCGYCLDEHYSYCDDCDDYHHKDCGQELADGFHCNECLDNHYHLCHSCGEHIHNEDATLIDDQFYCECCAEDINEDVGVERLISV